MIARHIDDARALARLAQELLHHVVVRLRPVPARAQLPAVDDVADEIDRLGVVPAQEVEQPLGLAAARAEMHVGDEQCAEACAALSSVTSAGSHVADHAASYANSYCGSMTATRTPFHWQRAVAPAAARHRAVIAPR